MAEISIGNFSLDDDDMQDIGRMVIADKAKQLRSDHEGMSLPEIAALHNINLGYHNDQQSEGLRGEKDGKKYILLDPKRSNKQNEKQFYQLLASFVWEDENKE